MNTATAKPKIDYESNRPVKFVSSLPKEQSPFFVNIGTNRAPERGEQIAHGGEMNIPLEYSFVDEEGNTKIWRYISGYQELDLQEQVKRGLDPIGKYKHNRGDAIIMTRGVIEVVPSKEPNKIRFLMNHPCNGLNKKRDPNAVVLFNFDDAQLRAKDQLSKNKPLIKAEALVISLEGNARKIQDLCTLFSIDKNMTEEEIINQLLAHAKLDPKFMISAIETDENKIGILLQSAIDSGVINFNGFKYYFTSNDATITAFQGRQKEENAFKKLVAFCESGDGEIHLKTIEKFMEEKVMEEASINTR